MDWPKILKIPPEELTEDEKDHLYDVVAWHNFDEQDDVLDVDKFIAFIKISQEIMKHKHEQVEVLMAELDEIATKQGEEEARKNQEELRHSKHDKKSADYEELEAKYKEIKSRLKQQIRTNENLQKENVLLHQKMTELESEVAHLNEEIQHSLNRGEDSSSETSEGALDKKVELLEMVNEKNKRISDLLNDIETVEAENVKLHETVTELRDNLQDATNQAELITNDFEGLKIKLEESIEDLQTMKEENEKLTAEIQEVVGKNKERDIETEKLTLSLQTQIDDLKGILEGKNIELVNLKSKLRNVSSSGGSSTSSSSAEYDSTVEENKALTKLIEEREEQIALLRLELQSATKEMEKGASKINQLRSENISLSRKINELNELMGDLKAQLHSSHERSRDLQEQLGIVEGIAKGKQEDLDLILNKINNEGNTELAEDMENVVKLRTQLRTQDRKLVNYVKSINKLQASVEELQQENEALRDKLQIPSDEEINVNGVILKKRKETRLIEKLHKQISSLENDKLELRNKVHDLNRQMQSSVVASLTKSSEIEKADETKQKSVENSDKKDEKYVQVLEENDALRKGLKEILENIHTKNANSKREIKSEALEKLLMALDMRHVSGWYHPAMRLQAELNKLQGINFELREQLKFARSERKSSLEERSTDLKEIDQVDANKSTVGPKKQFSISSQDKGDYETVQNETVVKLVKTLNEYNKNITVIEQQLQLIYTQHHSEKSAWEEQEKELALDKLDQEQKIAVLEAKLSEFSNASGKDERVIQERLAELSDNVVILNRKCVFLENSDCKQTQEIKKLKNDLANAKIAALEKISNLKEENCELRTRIDVAEKSADKTVDRQILINVQNNLDSVTLKYRELLNKFNSIQGEYSNHLVVLNETLKSVEDQNTELRSKLSGVLAKLNKQESVVPENVEELSKRLAQFEITELAEKQRANHMHNLYVVVKEQLAKLETRYEDLEAQNRELLKSNLALQENAKNLENKLMEYIGVEDSVNVESKHELWLQQNAKLTLENDKLKAKLDVVSKKQYLIDNATENSSSLDVLNLKHQILDLQASSDDKALIARLSSDVILARLSETQCQKRLEDLELELKEYQDNCHTIRSLLDQEKVNKQITIQNLKNKICILEDLVLHLRQQYLGSLPLISQEIFNLNLQQIFKDKQDTFKILVQNRKTHHECLLLQEELNKRNALLKELKSNVQNYNNDVLEKLKAWHQEKNIIMIKELKVERDIEFKNGQLDQMLSRLNAQDELITKLQEELLFCYNNCNMLPSNFQPKSTSSPILLKTASIQTDKSEKQSAIKRQLSFKNQELQTEEVASVVPTEHIPDIAIASFQSTIEQFEEEIRKKTELIDQLRVKNADIEMNLSLFRTQIGDKQSQISFYEKHILELQSKLTKVLEDKSQDVSSVETDEVIILKETIKKLQETNAEKDESIIKFQTLLKQDRDEHSLAAERMQQEMQKLQDVIAMREKAYLDLKETSIQHPGKAAIEQYIQQVHALEKHTNELHTTVSTLNSQLQSSREESSRWQELANERLESMEKLRFELDKQHQNELNIYKRESEKWREEIVKLKELIGKHRSDTQVEDPDISLKLKQKDEKIHELNVSLRQLKNEIRKHSDKLLFDSSTARSEPENQNDQLHKEYEALKKRYEQVLLRERNAKDEVLNLKEQILKKPPISARSDKSDKEYLQKKINNLEKEIEDLKSKLEKQIAINDAHKVAVTEDFEKWKKQKYWQQNCDKMKVKLQEKTEECEKLAQSCIGYKSLIERLEREKYGLESRIKLLKNNSSRFVQEKIENMQEENDELSAQVAALSDRLEAQQRHSGALGAAMLEEKLEAQERKIAILEIGSKQGSGEIRGELERLHSTVETMQKSSLRLEAENLELKLDLEKSRQEVPRYREQLAHLENYIQVLKSENETKDSNLISERKEPAGSENKKISELERTVFVLKRVVEKLQLENKRLQGGSRLCTTTDRGTDKLRIEHARLKEQHGECARKFSTLEAQLRAAKNKVTALEKQLENAKNFESMAEELSKVKEDLSYKTQLLDKVKILLHKAAIKEKALLDEVSRLKAAIASRISSSENSLS